jgi:hypothetical protein
MIAVDSTTGGLDLAAIRPGVAPARIAASITRALTAIAGGQAE